MRIQEKWLILGDMHLALYCHTAVSYQHFIYVLGGFHSGVIEKASTLQLDTRNEKWSLKAEMPQTCVRGSSVVYRDRIYVLGGSRNCCMSYDPHQDQWMTHAKPPTKHDRASAVVWKDRILLCGGTDTSVIEEFDPDTDKWSVWKYQLPQEADYPAVFAVHL